MKYLNFIETYFGFSPDGGNGFWGLAVLLLFVVLGTLVGLLLPTNGKSNGTKPLD
jgi:hypothetical protein